MSARHYENFDVSVRVNDTGGLEIAVLDSPAGEARETHDWPFSDQDLEIFLLRVGQTRRGVRRIDSPQMEAARRFGTSLYEAVFAGSIGSAFERSLDEVRRAGKGLRVRLRTADSPMLTDVPWEFLYSPPLRRFVTVSTTTPLVRYIEQAQIAAPFSVDGSLRILTMVSSPTDAAELNVEEEWERIQDALHDLVDTGAIEIQRLPNATMRSLAQELRRNDYHVFHFIGHGSFDATRDDGVLMFEDDQSRGHRVSSEQLGTILHDHDPLRLVILNSCEGSRAGPRDPFAGTAQGLVLQGIPAVIAMQFEITDEAAIIFSHDFYAAVADGYPVDAALAEARKAIFTSGNDVEWGTPVLHMRTPNGRVFAAPAAPAGSRPKKGLESESSASKDRSDKGLEKLYLQAQADIEANDWGNATGHLATILAKDPTFRDVAELQEAAQTHAAASRLHDEALEASAARDWTGVIDRLASLRELGLPDADGVGELEAIALAHLAADTNDDNHVSHSSANPSAVDSTDHTNAEDGSSDGVHPDAAALLAVAHGHADSRRWDAALRTLDKLDEGWPHTETGVSLRARVEAEKVQQLDRRKRIRITSLAALAVVTVAIVAAFWFRPSPPTPEDSTSTTADETTTTALTSTTKIETYVVPTLSQLQARGRALGIDETSEIQSPELSSLSWECGDPAQTFFSGDGHIEWLEMWNSGYAIYAHEFESVDQAEVAAAEFAELYDNCKVLPLGDEVVRTRSTTVAPYPMWDSKRYRGGELNPLGEHVWAVLVRGQLVVRILAPSTLELFDVEVQLGLSPSE